MKRLEFEREFLRTARDFLRCRLLVMGGNTGGDSSGGMEGALLGMLDWEGEMRLLCQEGKGESGKAQEVSRQRRHSVSA